MKTKLIILFLVLPVRAWAQNVKVVNPDASPVPVKVMSGGTITEITDPHIVAVPGSTPSPSPAKAIAVQGTGTTNAALPILTVPKQYTGTPSTFTIGTSDGTVFTLAAGEVGFIQNLDDAALAVKKGASASTTSLSFILAAGTAADDGKGGAVRIDDWVGVVSVAAMAGSPRFIAWKQAP